MDRQFSHFRPIYLLNKFSYDMKALEFHSMMSCIVCRERGDGEKRREKKVGQVTTHNKIQIIQTNKLRHHLETAMAKMMKLTWQIEELGNCEVEEKLMSHTPLMWKWSSIVASITADECLRCALFPLVWFYGSFATLITTSHMIPATEFCHEL